MKQHIKTNHLLAQLKLLASSPKTKVSCGVSLHTDCLLATFMEKKKKLSANIMIRKEK